MGSLSLARSRRYPARRSIGAHAVAAIPLASIEAHIRPAQQLIDGYLRIAEVLGAAHAQTDSQRYEPRRRHHRLSLDAGANALRHFHRAAQSGLRQHRGELLAADPG